MLRFVFSFLVGGLVLRGVFGLVGWLVGFGWVGGLFSFEVGWWVGGICLLWVVCLCVYVTMLFIVITIVTFGLLLFDWLFVLFGC